MAKGPEKPKLPEGLFQRLKALVSELEAQESTDKTRTEGGTLEFKLDADTALWYIAYKTD